MAEKDKKFSDWAPLVATASLLCGAIWVNEAPDTPRPKPLQRGDSFHSYQDVDARLWEDPFTAVIKHKENQHAKEECFRITLDGNNTVTETPKNLNGDTDTHCKKTKNNEIDTDKLKTVLEGKSSVKYIGAMVNGGPYVGLEEFRRETRYAVISALKEDKYFPVDSEHIGHIPMPGKNLNDPAHDYFIPFELFKKDNDDEWILLFWLNEEIIDSDDVKEGIPRPIKVMDEIYRAFIPKNQKINAVEIDIIGPNASGTLLHMADEVKQSKKIKSEITRINFNLYSPWATISSERLQVIYKKDSLGFLEGKEDYLEFLKGKQVSLENFNISLNRILPDDHHLSNSLIKELKLRNIECRDIVLISQWDTPYARNLSKDLTDICLNINITSFEFIRGLDGKIGFNSLGNERHSLNNIDGKDSSVFSATKEIQRAEGDSQIDYLERIESLLVKQYKEKPFKAIGIIANDYYDKLLVLSTLKPAFPQAVFFTTDLDANMYNSRDNKYTQNLLVSTPLNLSLPPSLQGTTPPFRNSLQTASFLATRAIFHDKLKSVFHDNQKSIESMVFEIGKYKPISPYLLDSSTCKTINDCNSLLVNDIYPDIKTPKLKYFFGALISIALLLTLLIDNNVISFINLTKTAINRTKHLSRYKNKIIFCILFLIFLGFFYLYHSHIEPFYLFQGISIWPSEILRVSSVILAFIFVYKIKNRINDTDERICCHFSDLKLKDFLKLDSEHFQPWEVLNNKYDTKKIDAISNLKIYLNQPLLSKCVIHSTLYFLGGIFFISAYEFPNTPARGEIDRNFDIVITLFAGLSYLFVLFYVYNAIARIVNLAKHLWGDTIWDKQILNRYGLPSTLNDNYNNEISFGDWLDLKLIARASEDVTYFIFYPILLQFLLLMARSRLFDNWSISLPVLIFHLASLFIAISAAWRLRSNAESAREHALEYFNIYLLRCKGQRMGYPMSYKTDAVAYQYANLCEEIIIQIKNLNTGAFSPIMQQPFVQAILASIASLSSISLLEYFQFGM